MDGVHLDVIGSQGQYKSGYFRLFNKTGVTGVFPSENTALTGQHDQWNALGCSCQASSVVWASYALHGHYDYDPHVRGIDQVEKVNKGVPTGWNWSIPGMYAAGIGVLAHRINLGAVPIGHGDRMTMIEWMHNTRGVYIMVSEGAHCLAAATNVNQATYHYDNEIGCARCANLEAWKAWVKWCGDVWEESNKTWHIIEVLLH